MALDKLFQDHERLPNNQSRVKSFFRYFERARKLTSNAAKAMENITGKVEQRLRLQSRGLRAPFESHPQVAGGPRKPN
jgi:hypothetical protein